MAIFFSAAVEHTAPDGQTRKGGFFDTEIHPPESIPDDAQEVTPARYKSLIEAQADGKEIYADDDGTPRFRARTITADQLRDNLAKAIRREAAARIDQVSPIWQQMNDGRFRSPAGDRRFVHIDAIRNASNAIETTLADMTADQLDKFTISKCPIWPEFF